MEVTIIGRDRFKKEFLSEVERTEDTFYIVILEPDENTPLREPLESYREYVFYDLEDDMDNGAGFIYKSISNEQAKDMFGFIKTHSDKKKCVVSCAAGISRSGAVGSFVHEYFGGRYKDLLQTHPHILPNGKVCRLLRMYERFDNISEDDLKIMF